MSGKHGADIVIFRALGSASALLAIVLARCGRDVRYLKLSPRLATDKMAASLAAKGVRALSYEDVEEGLGKYCRLLSAWSTFLFREHIRNVDVEAAIADGLQLNAKARDRFSLACEHYLQSELEEPVELLLYCQELTAQRPAARIAVIDREVPTRLLFRHAAKDENWRLVGLPRVPLLGYMAQLAARYLRLLGKSRRKVRGDAGGHAPAVPETEFDQPIVYFPHQGVFFGVLFAKDHYYNVKEKTSELHPSKVLHLSLGDSADTLAESHAYYRRHGIPHADLMQMSAVSPHAWLLSYLRLLAGPHLALCALMQRPFRVYSAMFYFARYAHLQLLLAGLRRLPRARLALVGYDILFPPMLSAALAACSIVVAATQERFFATFYNIFRLAFDYYFPLGDRVCRHIRQRPEIFSIGQCLPVGPVRSELIALAQPKLPDKYLQIKQQRVLVLALDWHSVPTAVENARIKTNTWRANRRYYKDMIRLAAEFPQIHVVVKGRDNSSQIPAMEDVCKAIEGMPNMSIERDHETYPPSVIAAAADLTVACHTSLVDELLAAGRPAISYDFCGFPTGLFDYDGYPMIVRNYEELRGRILQFLTDGQFMDDAQFAQLRRDFYDVIPGESSPREKLHGHLERILREGAQQGGSND